jgi:hypothetical protein
MDADEDRKYFAAKEHREHKEKAGTFAHEWHELHERGECLDRIYRMDIMGSGT